MDNGFSLFRSKTTGKTGRYPDFFASWPDFELVNEESEVLGSGSQGASVSAEVTFTAPTRNPERGEK